MGTDVAVQDSMFTLVDRETGRVLALRADITPQIARIVATRLRDEPKPVRLAYVTNIFRYDEPRVSHYREFYQAGVELIGPSKPEAEVEVIAMAIEGLRALGLGALPARPEPSGLLPRAAGRGQDRSGAPARAAAGAGPQGRGHARARGG